MTTECLGFLDEFACMCERRASGGCVRVGGGGAGPVVAVVAWRRIGKGFDEGP